uniref:Uncharacterized protein n=1 Tax=Meloidogyne enterolobii TaxID=390850 RepID=A0A6V7U4M2_MELEN|nr:unnamed protein product [Meloidogyne enterolobii]
MFVYIWMELKKIGGQVRGKNFGEGRGYFLILFFSRRDCCGGDRSSSFAQKVFKNSKMS